jgi:hypothetical protein
MGPGTFRISITCTRLQRMTIIQNAKRLMIWKAFGYSVWQELFGRNLNDQLRKRCGNVVSSISLNKNVLFFSHNVHRAANLATLWMSLLRKGGKDSMMHHKAAYLWNQKKQQALCFVYQHINQGTSTLL